MVPPLLSIEDPASFCTVKLDVVLNLKRTISEDYDHDIKDEVSRSCKEFRQKQKFQKLLDDLQQADNGKDLEEKKQIENKLKGFDSSVEKDLSANQNISKTPRPVQNDLSGESKIGKSPPENVIKMISN